MKNLLLLAVVFSICYGCEQPLDDPTGLVGTWNVTDKVLHTYDEAGENITSTEANLAGVEQYIFHANGRGRGTDDIFPSGFDFEWTLEDDILTVDTDLSTLPYIVTDVAYTRVWTVEEKTASKMVLSMRYGPWIHEPETRDMVPETENRILYYTLSKAINK